MSENVLRLENITMQFGGVIAVNDLSLEVNKGEIVSLIGPNGAGKTTVFNVVTGVYEPTNGAIYYNGNKIISNHPQGKMKKLYAGNDPHKFHDVITQTPDKITRMGVARTFQNLRLFSNMSVLDNVKVGLFHHMKYNLMDSLIRTPRYRREEKRADERALELLSIFDMQDMANMQAGSLPYGAQRRLEIVRALATNPSLLLLDERAAGMNPSETYDLMENIVKIRDTFQIAVMLIEHDMKLVMGICEGICVLNFGKVIAKGTAEEIQANPAVIEAYLGKKKEG